MKRKWFIGIDVSKNTLDVAIYNGTNGKSIVHTKVTNDSTGLKNRK